MNCTDKNSILGNIEPTLITAVDFLQSTFALSGEPGTYLVVGAREKTVEPLDRILNNLVIRVFVRRYMLALTSYWLPSKIIP